MPELLKDRFNYELLYQISLSIQTIYQPFQAEEFLKAAIDETWNDLQLKARCRKISTSLRQFLPNDYKQALRILEQAVTGVSHAYFFPDFIEVYGLDDENWDVSINALERTTPYWSAEFAVRAFIIKDEKRMMAQMYAWSEHENEHVRRLACEGCRPQLPWGQAIVSFKKDPTPVLPVLEQLKCDSSLYVRKSVANNLNDISKTHPELVITLAKSWYGAKKETDWIVKNGCRTLLKNGNHDVMALFAFGDSDSVKLLEFTLGAAAVSIGGSIPFSFTIVAEKAAKVRLEYGIDFVKANGKRQRKRFKISEVTLKEKEKKTYEKKHVLADLSVRKHYTGIHSIAIIINGVELSKLDFLLTEASPVM